MIEFWYMRNPIKDSDLYDNHPQGSNYGDKRSHMDFFEFEDVSKPCTGRV